MTSVQYLDAISKVAQAHFQPNDPDGSMTVARLGVLVRQTTGADPWSSGFSKFKEALLELERRGVVQTCTNSKQAFAFKLASESPSPSQASPAIGSHYERTNVPNRQFFMPSFKPLRGNIWLSFVNVSPHGRRFLNRVTGEIQLGQAAVPVPPDDWVEINPIDPATERQEAKEFLEAEGLGDRADLREPIARDAWFREFPARLATVSPALCSQWNRARSSRVIQAVERWRLENGIPEEVVYDKSKTKLELPSARPANKETELRRLIFEALRNLRTDELLLLSVPIKDIINVVRPELMRT